MLLDSLGTRASFVRFGPFEADLRAEALRRDGHFIQIQQQPFQILATLLECPGETVTREPLRQRLWPDGLHVDVDENLERHLGLDRWESLVPDSTTVSSRPIHQIRRCIRLHLG